MIKQLQTEIKIENIINNYDLFDYYLLFIEVFINQKLKIF